MFVQSTATKEHSQIFVLGLIQAPSFVESSRTPGRIAIITEIFEEIILVCYEAQSFNEAPAKWRQRTRIFLIIHSSQDFLVTIVTE